MGERLNCWEFTRCGREPQGERVSELGVCPAATAANANGLNSGNNGGRICWAIAGSLTDSTVEGTNAREKLLCFLCDFFKLVQAEEGSEKFRVLRPKQLLFHIP